MEFVPLLDCAGRRRSPATTSNFHEGLSPRNKGLRYPPAPPTVEEIVSVMRAGGESAEGVRLRCIIVVLQALEDLLVLKVDLVSEGGISPYLREQILSKPSLCEHPARLRPPHCRRDPRRNRIHPGRPRRLLRRSETQGAVIRNIEILGQAVKGLSAETRAHDDSIPWRQIAGMRDKLIHEYFGVDLNLVWDVVERELPTLRPRIAAVLESVTE